MNEVEQMTLVQQWPTKIFPTLLQYSMNENLLEELTKMRRYSLLRRQLTLPQRPNGLTNIGLANPNTSIAFIWVMNGTSTTRPTTIMIIHHPRLCRATSSISFIPI